MKPKNKAAAALGKKGGKVGGKVKSEAKTAAARANGAKGGRPKKTPKTLTEFCGLPSDSFGKHIAEFPPSS